MLGGGGALKREDGIAAQIERRSTMHTGVVALQGDWFATSMLERL